MLWQRVRAALAESEVGPGSYAVDPEPVQDGRAEKPSMGSTPRFEDPADSRASNPGPGAYDAVQSRRLPTAWMGRTTPDPAAVRRRRRRQRYEFVPV